MGNDSRHEKLDHSAFVGCTSFNGNGGAICVRCDECAISGEGKSGEGTGCNGTSGFINCSARQGAGGAIRLFEIDDNTAGLKVDNLYFYQCYCGVDGSMPKLSTNPNSALSGGAISTDASYMRISNCDFEFCLAGGRGGAIDVAGNHWQLMPLALALRLLGDHDRVTLEKLNLKNCNAVDLGKDIYFSSFIGVLRNITLVANDNYRLRGNSHENPSARIIIYNDTSLITFENVAITDNFEVASSISPGNIFAIFAFAAAAGIITVLLVIVKKKKKTAN